MVDFPPSPVPRRRIRHGGCCGVGLLWWWFGDWGMCGGGFGVEDEFGVCFDLPTTVFGEPMKDFTFLSAKCRNSIISCGGTHCVSIWY